MEQESNKYILNIPHRPNRTAKLIALPMYMYRIQTNVFEYGINFFQKAVLMLKMRPGLFDRDIAAYLGLDERLVAIISSELTTMGLIDSKGILTDKGRLVKKEIDGLVVSEGKKQIGYVFQYVNNADLYPYYVKNIEVVPFIKSAERVRVVTGTKGDSGDEDFYTEAIVPTELLSHIQVNPAPSEREVLSVIRRSDKHARAKKDSSEGHTEVKGNLSLSFIPDNHPELVWVCTYIYLPKIDENVYDNEWRVLDPFGNGNNIDLKFYIEDLIRRKIIGDIGSLFNEYSTTGDEAVNVYNEFVDQMVEDRMDKMFDLGYQRLDANLLLYMRSVVKFFCLMDKNPSIDNSDAFCSNIQKALETIILYDKEKRTNEYEDLSNNYQDNEYLTTTYCERERNKVIRRIFREGIVSAPSQQGRICALTKYTAPKKADSLKKHLCMLLLTYNRHKENILIEILKDKLDFIFEFSDDRNDSQHGDTSTNRVVSALSPNDIQRYMNEFQTIVNDFINKYHG